jgi:hypothetical protein
VWRYLSVIGNNFRAPQGAERGFSCSATVTPTGNPGRSPASGGRLAQTYRQPGVENSNPGHTAEGGSPVYTFSVAQEAALMDWSLVQTMREDRDKDPTEKLIRIYQTRSRWYSEEAFEAIR